MGKSKKNKQESLSTEEAVREIMRLMKQDPESIYYKPIEEKPLEKNIEVKLLKTVDKEGESYRQFNNLVEYYNLLVQYPEEIAGLIESMKQVSDAHPGAIDKLTPDEFIETYQEEILCAYYENERKKKGG